MAVLLRMEVTSQSAPKKIWKKLAIESFMSRNITFVVRFCMYLNIYQNYLHFFWSIRAMYILHLQLPPSVLDISSPHGKREREKKLNLKLLKFSCGHKSWYCCIVKRIRMIARPFILRRRRRKSFETMRERGRLYKQHYQLLDHFLKKIIRYACPTRLLLGLEL